MNYTVLRGEVLGDSKYHGLASSAVADMLNASTIPTKKEVEAKELRRILLMSGKLGLMKYLSIPGGAGLISPPLTATQQLEISALCNTVIMVLEPGAFATIDYTNPTIYGTIEFMLQKLVEAGIINNELKSTILAVGNSTMSRASQLGLGIVTADDVNRARDGA